MACRQAGLPIPPSGHSNITIGEMKNKKSPDSSIQSRYWHVFILSTRLFDILQEFLS
jgi:hypothetical protein